jgi:hypothetical protein
VVVETVHRGSEGCWQILHVQNILLSFPSSALPVETSIVGWLLHPLSYDICFAFSPLTNEDQVLNCLLQMTLRTKSCVD